MIEIHVKDYYGNPSYYSVMPQEIFNALETAFLDGVGTCKVDKNQFGKMLAEYQKKMDDAKGIV